MSVIKLKNVNKDFGKGSSKVHILDNVNFSADNGQLILILGPSGSGKSTFLTIAGSLQTPTSGKVEVNGKEIHNMTSKQQEKLRLNDIGFILQSYNLIPYLKVKDQFKLVDRIRKSGNLSKERLDHLFDILGIANLKDKYPSELSGGQLQRVAIARALYTNPKIILADEPTAALDSERVNEVGKLLHKLAKEENKAVIVVTHDLRLTQYADKIYDIIDGKLTLRK